MTDTRKALVDEWLKRHRLRDGDYHYGGEWAICANELAALLAATPDICPWCNEAVAPGGPFRKAHWPTCPNGWQRLA